MVKNITWVTNVPLRDALAHLNRKPRGSGFWLDALRDEMVRHGLRVNVVTPTTFVTRTESFDTPGGSFYLIPLGITAHIPCLNGKVLSTLAQSVSETRAEVVDYHGTEYGYALAHRYLQCPAIVTIQGVIHDVVPTYYGPSGALSFFVKSLLNGGFSNLLAQPATMLSYRQRLWLEARVFKLHANYLGRTPYDLEWARQLHGGKIFYQTAHRILRPSFYSSDAWRRPRLPGGKFVICRTGRFAPDKGIDNLMRAVARIRSQEGIDVTLRIIGGDKPTSGWGVSLVKLSEELGIDDAIEYLGYLNEEEIIRNLAQADVFVLSSYSENSPNSLVEAMCLGLPCVASDVGGTRSIVEDGVSGLLYASLSYEDLAEKLLAIERDPARAAEMGAAARLSVMKKNDPKEVLASTLAAYESVSQ